MADDYLPEELQKARRHILPIEMMDSLPPGAANILEIDRLDRMDAALAGLEKDYLDTTAAINAELNTQCIEAILPDAKLGQSRRYDLKEFGKTRGTDIHNERVKVWGTWYDKAKEIQDGRTKKASMAELVRKVIPELTLSEGEQAVSKGIAKYIKEKGLPKLT